MIRLSVIAAAAMFGSAANAAPIVLTFEGIGNFNSVGNVYSSQGITFPNGVAVVEQAAGGSGNFTNEPSPSSVLFFTVIGRAIANVPAGFTDSFSFYYSSEVDTNIRIYDDLNAAGHVLANIPITNQYGDGCGGMDTGVFCNWTRATVDFGGTAKSVSFGGAPRFAFFDNLTFGGAGLGSTAVPEPASWALLVTGFGLLGVARRRRPVGA